MEGSVELTVARRDADASSEVPALAYTDLMAAVGRRPGAAERRSPGRGLGTGGYALVIAVLDAEGQGGAQPPQPKGHLVKARYLPLQAMVAGADEQGSAHHELLAEALDCRDASCRRRLAFSASVPRAARDRARPARHPGRLRDERSRRVATRVLPPGSGAAGQRPAAGR